MPSTMAPRDSVPGSSTTYKPERIVASANPPTRPSSIRLTRITLRSGPSLLCSTLDMDPPITPYWPSNCIPIPTYFSLLLHEPLAMAFLWLHATFVINVVIIARYHVFILTGVHLVTGRHYPHARCSPSPSFATVTRPYSSSSRVNASSSRTSSTTSFLPMEKHPPLRPVSAARRKASVPTG